MPESGKWEWLKTIWLSAYAGSNPVSRRIFLKKKASPKKKMKSKLKKIKRGPAIMLQKDIGSILGGTCIDKDSVVLDAGSGCGVLTINLARFVKKVYSYDNRKEFLEIAKENVKKFNLKNVVFKNKDVYEEIKERDLDLITLDLKEPWKALDNCRKALKDKGELVVYSPQITQVKELIDSLNGFEVVEVKEVNERNWVVDERRCRPEHTGLMHTGFLVFLRKI